MSYKRQIEQVEQICLQIESGKEYLTDLKDYLPELNKTITVILKEASDEESNLQINEEFVIQVLKDIIYGIEHEDEVCLLDTLRYGLLTIYDYIENE